MNRKITEDVPDPSEYAEADDYVCDICERRFDRACELGNHRKHKHKGRIRGPTCHTVSEIIHNNASVNVSMPSADTATIMTDPLSTICQKDALESMFPTLMALKKAGVVVTVNIDIDLEAP